MDDGRRKDGSIGRRGKWPEGWLAYPVKGKRYKLIRMFHDNKILGMPQLNLLYGSGQIISKEVKNIKSFLYRVAVNLIIDHSRKKKTLAFDEVKEKEVSVRLYSMEGSIIDRFEVQEIIKILDDLDEKYRQVIIMRYINQLSPPEIADILEISTNAVSVKINYAIKKIREIIKIKYHES